jgi:hypothetical protein
MDEPAQVAVSRRIAAAASDIFQVLVDPKSHLAMDDSGMVRGSVSDTAVSAVGDVFVIKMYYVEHGDYEMNNHVVEYEQTGASVGSRRLDADTPTLSGLRPIAAGDNGGSTTWFPMVQRRPS